MGLFRKIFGDRSSEAFGKDWLETYWKTYLWLEHTGPHAPPVANLKETWLRHFGKYPELNAHLLLPHVISHAACFHACVETPHCGTALGYWMVKSFHPQVCERNPQFDCVYQVLMAKPLSLLEAEEYDALNQLFARYNSQARSQSPFPIRIGDAYEWY